MINPKLQAPKYKLNYKNQAPNNKHYDLEERTYIFAIQCRDFVKKLTRTISNIEYGKQLVRSSGSQAANYIEANESLSKQDFRHRIKICLKEVKESRLWLRLCDIEDTLGNEQRQLIQEAQELTRIFSAILKKSEIIVIK